MKRREFIKKGSLAGIGTAASVSLLKQASAKEESTSAGANVKFEDSIDELYEFNEDYQRFRQKNTAFNLSFWSGRNPFTPEAKIEYPTSEDTPVKELTGEGIGKSGFGRLLAGVLWKQKYGKDPAGTPGFTALDKSLKDATCATETLTGSIFSRAFSGDSGPEITIRNKTGGKMFDLPFSLVKPHFPSGFAVEKDRWKFSSKKEASQVIKKAARLCGADLVGIAPFDERFIYKSQVHFPFDALSGKLKDGKSHPDNKFNLDRPVSFISGLDKQGKPILFKPKSVIVLIHEMDYEAYKTSPSFISAAASSKGYAAMIEISLKVAKFLRGIGYFSMHAGNDTGLSVPLAISAGLGEGSRMGLLVTEEFGPRIRISKVFTDLELEHDKPKTFGVKGFCEVCQKCADSCPSGAISKVPRVTDPENQVPNRSVNSGVMKWYNDNQKCLSFWLDNTIECANCVACCPYNKLDTWNHDLAKVATKVPVLQRITRYLDEMFGYGEVGSLKNQKQFWKKNI